MTPPAAEPTEAGTDPELSFGWTTYAEQLNGRFAMVGILLLLLLELLSNQTFFQWIGWR
ncbi:high light inducible protein [Roseofilum sp. BLCC_M143]|uniref:High light inducible protein n=1 Tax=Roseofilum casamattae BLCC-M143 TaxID=3022442 RepID=A0ABT7BWS7_9CYAN|nr:high light inducible protein [Roseofilum casamattae BLCC-M143]